jgi:hypothetical protein
LRSAWTRRGRTACCSCSRRSRRSRCSRSRSSYSSPPGRRCPAAPGRCSSRRRASRSSSAPTRPGSRSLFGASAGLGWGWELITLLEGVALAAYAALRLEPGPAYLAFFVLLLFAATAAATGDGTGGGVVEIDGVEQESPAASASIVGWPIALAIATVAAALWALRRDRDQIAATS